MLKPSFDMDALRSKLGPFLLMLSVGACGDLSTYLNENREPVYDDVAMPVDGVKSIRESVQSGQDERSFFQARYEIAAEDRVLLRREDLINIAPDISISDSRRVELQITLSDDSQATLALTHLKLCPLLKNWMMLATWTKAHPFGGGAWEHPGSDYDADRCLSPTAGDTPEVLLYDVTEFLQEQIQGYGVNFGWVLLASGKQSFSIVGDKASTAGPRLKYQVVR